MSSRYELLMDQVCVSEDMRTRILENIEVESSSVTSVSRWTAHKKTMISLAACFALIISCSTWILQEPAVDSPNLPTSGANHLAAVPPFVKVDTLEMLEETVGFPVEQVTRSPLVFTETSYMAYNTGMAEITYIGTQQSITFRKSIAQGDISGHYEKYSHNEIFSTRNWEITLKGDQSGYSLAVWSDEDYSYSLASSIPMEKDIWTATIEGIS